uniref:C-type lectin domain-containing protein n=1 Tax=Ditylenchus dipsaci TaxID=166011 RepID=A0A915CZ54_9BILA
MLADINRKSYLYFVLLCAYLNIAQGQESCGGGNGWSWTMAELKCVFQGAHIISIHDLNDNQFLAEMATQVGIIWLGAAQFGSSRNYVWSDYSPFAFEHWKDNRRPTFHPGRKCSKFVGAPGEYIVSSTGVIQSAQSGDWLQTCCKVAVPYICQKPAMQALPGAIIEDEGGEQFVGPSDIQQELRARRMRFSN